MNASSLELLEPFARSDHEKGISMLELSRTCRDDKVDRDDVVCRISAISDPSDHASLEGR